MTQQVFLLWLSFTKEEGVLSDQACPHCGEKPPRGQKGSCVQGQSDSLQITGSDSVLKGEGAKLSPRVDLQQCAKEFKTLCDSQEEREKTQLHLRVPSLWVTAG